ncbi:hypothetical protein A2U01_0078104, partial [Trifolium medium]|nr:hypothetical protein [Trifolium medium]
MYTTLLPFTGTEAEHYLRSHLWS